MRKIRARDGNGKRMTDFICCVDIVYALQSNSSSLCLFCIPFSFSLLAYSIKHSLVFWEHFSHAIHHNFLFFTFSSRLAIHPHLYRFNIAVERWLLCRHVKCSHSTFFSLTAFQKWMDEKSELKSLLFGNMMSVLWMKDASYLSSAALHFHMPG